MCGILGGINANFTVDSLKKLSHRGPDGSGWFEEGKIQLGHVRLSIQDTSEKAGQPFFSKDNNYVLVYNGEIYNHWEIREKLEKRGVKFVTTSDTETLLEGYIKYGEEIFKELNGIFAFALFDKVQKKLLIVRDRFGVKPLYYAIENNTLQFSSEIKALKPNSKELNSEALLNYVRYLWSPGKETPFKSVSKLLPGELIRIDLSKEKIEYEFEYFAKVTFDGSRIQKSENELINDLDELLTKAVERQLISDVPIGFFLSGGLDSSLIVAIARKINPSSKIKCFTIDTKEFSKTEGFSNDLEYAKKVADFLDVDLNVVDADSSIVDDFDEMIYFLDEPQADPAPLNVRNISRMAAKQGIKVLLGGTGGDDLFSGYRRHLLVENERFLNVIPQLVLDMLAGVSDSIKPNTANKRRFKKIFDTIKHEDRIFKYFEWLSHERALRLFDQNIQETVAKNPNEFFEKKLSEIHNESDIMNKFLYLEMNSFLVDHNLNYTDKMGMAEGVEIRVPFLDNELVDFVYKLDPKLKLRRRKTKYILKKVAERYLPKEVIYRSKAGFGAPVRKWVTQDLKHTIDDRLLNGMSSKHVFNKSELNTLIKENASNKIDASYPIWALLAIDSWIRQFINPEN